jgi:1,4-dihydroxy-2-naphthoate octaprenyltransferase
MGGTFLREAMSWAAIIAVALAFMVISAVLSGKFHPTSGYLPILFVGALCSIIGGFCGTALLRFWRSCLS